MNLIGSRPAPSTAFAFIAAAILAATALTADPAAAQDERIAGIWQKDIARSDAPWPGRPDRPQPNAADIEIEISLVGDNVELVQSARRRDWPTPQHVDVTYVTDNKPHAAADLASGRMQEVRARWRKKKLTVSFTVSLPGFEADVQQIWEITKQGDLLQTNVGRGAEGRPDIRRNYFVRAATVQ